MIAALLLIVAQPAGFGDAARPVTAHPSRSASQTQSRGAVAAARPGGRRLLDIDLSGLSDDDAVAIPASAPALPLRRLDEDRSGRLDPGIARLITSVQLPAAPVTSGTHGRGGGVASSRSTLARSTAPSYQPGRW